MGRNNRFTEKAQFCGIREGAGLVDGERAIALWRSTPKYKRNVERLALAVSCVWRGKQAKTSGGIRTWYMADKALAM